MDTKVLDEAIQAMREAEADYKAKKEISNQADAKHKELREKVIRLLVEADKDSYSVKGVGKVSLVESLKVSTPKTNEDKAALFKFLKERMGADGFLTYASVNYNSLNSLYKQLYEDAEDKENFTVDGVGNPTLERSIRFRKEN